MEKVISGTNSILDQKQQYRKHFKIIFDDFSNNGRKKFQKAILYIRFLKSVSWSHFGWTGTTLSLSTSE